jgi:methyltransferase-like protein/SAM-dependent methyltransferase
MSEAPPLLTYPNRAHEATHCDRMGVRARLLGVAAASAGKCRVLDLGCAGGANVVAMALDLPESEFVGVDLSSKEIATGHALIETLGVKNVKLSVANVMDVTRASVGGDFDFIVAHGLYSWVDKAAQAKILAIFGELLAPNGVAYVSYNTLPGWYTRAKARDLMLYHTASIADPHKKIEQGLASLKWLADAVGDTTSYGRDMAAELALLRATNEGYIFHEHFVDTSAAYFHEVAAAARAVGLQFLVESEATTTPLESLVPSVRDLLAKLDDPVKVEQYIDFVTDRRFRATLFCHADRKVNRVLDVGVVESGWISAACAIEGDALDLSDAHVTLASPQGARAQIAQPLLKLAFGILATRAPEPMTLAALVEATRARLALSPRASALADAATRLHAELANAILRLSMFGFVKLRGFAPKVTALPSERPIARPIAREQAKDDAIATNVWHETVGMTPIDRAVVQLLDGSRDRDALVRETKASRAEIEATLARMGRAGVLVG